MNYLIYQVYATYKRSASPNPDLMVRLFLLTLAFLLFLGIETIIVTLISLKSFGKSEEIIMTIGSYAVLLIAMIIIEKSIRKKYSRKVLEEILRKNSFSVLPSYVVYSVIVVSSILLMLLGPIVSSFLFGGAILGYQFEGIVR